jgi:hypothetical protein
MIALLFPVFGATTTTKTTLWMMQIQKAPLPSDTKSEQTLFPSLTKHGRIFCGQVAKVLERHPRSEADRRKSRLRQQQQRL